MPVCGDLFLLFTGLSHYRVALMDVLNFRGDKKKKISQKYLPHEYCENKSLAKLNMFTVYAPRHEKTCFRHMPTTKAQISLRGLISAVVIRCLDSIIPPVSISKISSL